MSAPLPSLSVIIPVYNEGRSVADVCLRARQVLEEADCPAFEMIVVDDGSTDGGLKNIPRGADVLIRHRRNRGYGAALKSGFARARHDILVFLDADGTYDPAYIPRLVAALNPETPMAVGARTGASVHVPFERRPAKWILTRLADYLAGRRIPDLNSGLRAVDRMELLGYVHLLPDGFSLTTTSTLAFICDGFEIAYLPINYPPRKGSKSKIRPLRDTQQIIITILRTIMYFNPLKVFLPLSLTLGVLAVLVFLIGLVAFDKVMDVTVAILTLSSVQCVVLGLLADSIGHASRPCPHRGKIIRPE